VQIAAAPDEHWGGGIRGWLSRDPQRSPSSGLTVSVSSSVFCRVVDRVRPEGRQAGVRPRITEKVRTAHPPYVVYVEMSGSPDMTWK